jgi:hypothetical protein
MFLVSRLFRDDANQVFFGKNHFRIDISRETSGYLIGQIPRPLRYPESEFLSDVVPINALRYIQSLEFKFLTFSHWPFAHQPPTAENSQPEEHQDWLRTVSRIVSDDSFDHRLPTLVLRVATINLPELDSMLSSRELSPEQSNSAIDLLKTYVATLWPPLFQSSQSGKLGVLFAYLDTETLRVGYFIRPGQPHQEERSSYESPYFASERDKADLKVERTAVALDGGELGLDGDGSKWVEGIWVIFQDY